MQWPQYWLKTANEIKNRLSYLHLLKALIVLPVAGGFLLAFDRLISFIVSDQGTTGLNLSAGITLAGGYALLLAIIALLYALHVIVACFLLPVFRGRMPLSVIVAIFVGILFSFLFFWVGQELSSGVWISQKSYSWVFRWGPAVLGGLSHGFAVWLAFYLIGKISQKKRLLVTVGGVLTLFSFAVAFVNVALWYSLYPRLHIALTIVSALFIFGAVIFFLKTASQRLSLKSHLFVSGGSVFVVVAALFFWFTIDRTTRSELIVKSASSTDIIRVFATKSGENTLVYDSLVHLRATKNSFHKKKKRARNLINIPDDWNIVLVVVDAARADILPPVRKPGKKHVNPKDTPFLNQWLKNTYRFKNVYAQGACTDRSMPYFFRSLQSYEAVDQIGLPIADYIKTLDRKPVAVVTDLFMEPRRKNLTALLEGFESIDIYKESAMDEQIPKSLQMLESVKDEPFFAWFHFFCLHHPGYADGHLLSKKDGTPKQNHRKALKWFDQQFKKLIDGAGQMGLLDKTVFILASDHGQGLGDNRSHSHGSNVWEETVRVPLAIHIPGHKGRVIDEYVVGNIDILPTIAELLGGPESIHHRGHSLVPLLQGRKIPWQYDYFYRARHSKIVGLTRQHDKIIHDVEGDSIYRYDLLKDPTEDTNLFDIQGEIDQQLLRSIIYHSPSRFRADLKDTATQKLLLESLQEINSDRHFEEFLFLLKLAVLDPSKKSHQEVRRIFQSTSNDNVRLAIIDNMFSTDKKMWSAAIKKQLERVAGTPKEIEFVKQLALQGQVAFDPDYVANKMKWWSQKDNISSWEPWLSLVRNWDRKSNKNFALAFIAMLNQLKARSVSEGAYAKAEKNSEQRILTLIFDNISSLRLSKMKKERQKLNQAIRFYFDHPQDQVKAAAYKSMGYIGNKNDSQTLRQTFSTNSHTIQVRQAILSALARIDGKKVVSFALNQKNDPLLTLDIVLLCRKFRAKQCIPFLDEMSKKHPDFYIRDVSRNIKKRIAHKT